MEKRKKTPELVRRGPVIPVIDYLLAFIIDQHLFSSLEITPFLPIRRHSLATFFRTEGEVSTVCSFALTGRARLCHACVTGVFSRQLHVSQVKIQYVHSGDRGFVLNFSSVSENAFKFAAHTHTHTWLTANGGRGTGDGDGGRGASGLTLRDQRQQGQGQGIYRDEIRRHV